MLKRSGSISKIEPTKEEIKVGSNQKGETDAHAIIMRCTVTSYNVPFIPGYFKGGMKWRQT